MFWKRREQAWQPDGCFAAFLFHIDETLCIAFRGLTSSAVLRARYLHLRGARNGSLSGHSARSERTRCCLFFPYCLRVLERVVLQYCLIEWVYARNAGGLVTVERSRSGECVVITVPFACLPFSTQHNQYSDDNTASTLPNQTCLIYVRFFCLQCFVR